MPVNNSVPMLDPVKESAGSLLKAYWSQSVAAVAAKNSTMAFCPRAKRWVTLQ
ncbi:Uncharacterised protein [Vibrio cholerae]|nr:Uncharacterised protein [Vibrio cholerae]CSB25693.1 Uncharacterised protein [Vibrio cholerae]CSB33606.1 Uncharacterised protein [Vibrio cholerae]CSB74628.1 Uncharacterised protein [Vibrio cholerae]CSC34100.1 Uncharacterised protein [Vibrio cholerae]